MDYGIRGKDSGTTGLADKPSDGIMMHQIRLSAIVLHHLLLRLSDELHLTPVGMP